MNLVEYIKANKPKVYTVLNHVSSSGMTRAISAYIVKDGELVNINHVAKEQLGWKTDLKHGGLKVSGAGMDMGFHLVYSLSASLFGYEDKGAYSLSQQWL